MTYRTRDEHANHYTTDAVKAMNAFVYNKNIDDAGIKAFVVIEGAEIYSSCFIDGFDIRIPKSSTFFIFTSLCNISVVSRCNIESFSNKSETSNFATTFRA